MLEAEADHKKNLEKVNNNLPKQELNKESKDTNSDPTLLSLRNNQKLNSIIEEVRNLFESDSV